MRSSASGRLLVLCSGDGLVEQGAQAHPVRQAGDRVEIRHAVDGLLGRRGPGAGSQGAEAIAEVGGRRHQQLNFLVVECISLRGGDAQGAGELALDAQGKRDDRGVSAQARFFAKRVLGIVDSVAEHKGLAGFHRGGDAAAERRCTPASGQGGEALVEACMCHRSSGSGVIVLGIADPRQPVSAVPHGDAADLVEQRRLVGRADQRTVDRCPGLQGAIQAKDFLSGAQGLQAECEVLRGFGENLHLLLFERVGLGRGDGQRAEYLALESQWQREHRTDAALAGQLTPSLRIRIRRGVADDAGLAGTDGDAGGAAPMLVIGPGQALRVRRRGVIAGQRQWGDRLARVVLGTHHPRRVVAGLLDHDATDLAQQRCLLLGPKQCAVAAAQGSQRPGDACEFLLLGAGLLHDSPLLE